MYLVPLVAFVAVCSTNPMQEIILPLNVCLRLVNVVYMSSVITVWAKLPTYTHAKQLVPHFKLCTNVFIQAEL